MTVEERVLARIRPSPDEEARIEKVVRELLERLRATLKSNGWDAKPFLAGSVAKGTHLTGTEIDVFVAFPPDLPRADLEERGLALGADAYIVKRKFDHEELLETIRQIL